MKKRKLVSIFAAASCCAVLLTGCSITDIFNGFVDATTETTETEVTADSAESVGSSEPVRVVDDSLMAPEFQVDLTGSSQVVQDTVFTLTAPAAVSDGGTVTYQWYVNNVDSNGGGTPIEGANTETCTVDTSTIGTSFYYVVATNNLGDNVKMSTSVTHSVTVWERGSWQPDEAGGVRYILSDGSFPTSLWIVIDDFTYHVDENGHRATGWYQEGDYLYYFNENGELQRDITTPDGHVVNSDGIMIS